MGNNQELEDVVAFVSEHVRPRMQQELMKSWRDGLRAGFGVARHMAETVRDELAARGARDQAEVLEGLMVALAQAAAEIPTLS